MGMSFNHIKFFKESVLGEKMSSRMGYDTEQTMSKYRPLIKYQFRYFADYMYNDAFQWSLYLCTF